ncbi:hypothetical protein LINGRAHAP2_LOCUS21460 [Linum grandiflorum]
MSERGESSHSSTRPVRLDAANLQDAKERANLSLLGRIFWDEPKDLRQVERVLNSVWTITTLRIIDVGYGLYQFVFPNTSKRSFVLRFQPWSFRRHLIHFTENLSPSAELFDSLQMMNVWVKLEGLPMACRTKAVGRRLLSQIGELKYVGLFDAGLSSGFYVKGLVRLNLFDSFQGTTEVDDDEGHVFPAYFQYININCICYRCGYQGHTVSECDRQDLVLDLSSRDSWISIPHNKDEHEVQGPGLQMVLNQRQTTRRDRNIMHLPPSVQAGLSTTFLRNRARQRGSSAADGRGAGQVPPGNRMLALPGPSGSRPQHVSPASSTESRSMALPNQQPHQRLHRTPQQPLDLTAPNQMSTSRNSQAKRKLFPEDKGKAKITDSVNSTIKTYRRRSTTLTIRELTEDGANSISSMMQQDSNQDTASSSARRLLASDIGGPSEVNSLAAAPIADTTGLEAIFNEEVEATGLDWSQPNR